MKTRIAPLVGVALLFWGTPALADPAPSCASAYGKTACGFHCVAEYGQIQCAKTPEGRCQAAYGKVTCWDPPPAERHRGHHREREAGESEAHPGSHRPRAAASCKSAYGKTECGYHCVAKYGKVACAATPEGACAAAYGKVTCWDPPRQRPRPRRETPRASCLAAYGQIACGYDCTAAYGKVRCATTPTRER